MAWYSKGKAIHLYGRMGIYISYELRQWTVGIEACGIMLRFYLGPLGLRILWRVGKEDGF